MSDRTPPGPHERRAPAFTPRLTNLLLGCFVGFAVVDLLYGGTWTNMGLLVPAFLWEGEWQRLFLAMFLHGDLLHVLANFALLLAVGTQVEIVYGRTRALACFLVSGLFAGVASTAFLPADATVTSSGGLMGLLGLLAGLLLLRHGMLPALAQGRIVVAIAAGVLFNLLLGFFSPYLNNVVHVAGMLSGLGLSLVLEPRHADVEHLPAASLGAGLALVAAMGLLLSRSMTAVVGTLPRAVLRAEELRTRGDVAAAIEVLRPQLERAPRGSAEHALLPAAQNQLAWYYVETGRNLEDGLRLSKQSNETRPGEPAFLDTLGYLHALLGQCREAADAMGRAAELDPGYARRRDEVTSACEKGHRPDPDLPVEPPPQLPEQPPGNARPASGRGIRT